MTQTAINYAEVLYELSVPEESIEKTEQIVQQVPQVGAALSSPVIALSAKEKIIDRIFPAEMRNYLKVLCKYQKADRMEEIFEAYREYKRRQNQILKATLWYVTLPREEQTEEIRSFLQKKFHCREVAFELKQKKDLIGGFLLQAGNQEYDWSLAGRFRQLEQKLIRR